MIPIKQKITGNGLFQSIKNIRGNHPVLAERLEELRANLRLENPVDLARRSGSTFFPSEIGNGKLIIKFWGDDISIVTPEFIAYDERIRDKLDLISQTLICYYLTTTDGNPPQDNWISFSELPDGRFYTQAFQGYTGVELSRNFQDNLEQFGIVANVLGGSYHRHGDSAYIFELLPYVNLLVVLWLGDEDFPTNYQVLFNANVHHHLPTDACAIAGSLLVRRLIKANNKI